MKYVATCKNIITILIKKEHNNNIIIFVGDEDRKQLIKKIRSFLRRGTL